MAFDLPLSRPARRRLEKLKLETPQRLPEPPVGPPTPGPTPVPTAAPQRVLRGRPQVTARQAPPAYELGDLLTGASPLLDVLDPSFRVRTEPPQIRPSNEIIVNGVVDRLYNYGTPDPMVPVDRVDPLDPLSYKPPAGVPEVSQRVPEFGDDVIRLRASGGWPIRGGEYQTSGEFVDYEDLASMIGPDDQLTQPRFGLDLTMIELPEGVKNKYFPIHGVLVPLLDEITLDQFEGLPSEIQGKIRMHPPSAARTEAYKQRETARLLAPKQSKGLSSALASMEAYDKEVLDTGAYHFIYGFQLALPGEQNYERRVRELIGTTVRGIDPITGLPNLKVVTDIHSLFTHGGPQNAPTALTLARDDGFLPWYMTEPVKLVIDPANLLLGVPGGGLVAMGARGLVRVAGAGARKTAATKALGQITDDAFTSSPYSRITYGRTSGAQYVQLRGMPKVRVSGPDPLRAEPKMPELWPTEQELQRVLEEGKRIMPFDYADEAAYPLLTDRPGVRWGEVGRGYVETRPPPPGQRPIEGLSTRIWEGPGTPFNPIGAVVRGVEEGPPALQSPAWLQYWGETGKVMEIGRLAVGARSTLVTPELSVLEAGARATQYFGFKPYTVGLRNFEKIQAWYQGSIGRGYGAVQEDPVGTAFGRVYLENVRGADRVSKTRSRLINANVDDAFPELNDSGQLERLVGIDETLEDAIPTIQDIAARLPKFWNHLTPDEQQAMLELQRFSQELEEILAESGSFYIPVGVREDIITDTVRAGVGAGKLVINKSGQPLTGFYLHRGHARKVKERMLKAGGLFKGIEIPRAQVQMGAYGGRRPAFTEESTVASMGQGIKGFIDKAEEFTQYRYPHFRAAMGEYIADVGESINKAMGSNHLLNYIDPQVGKLSDLAIRPADLIDKQLATKVERLRSRIHNGKSKLREYAAQSRVISEILGVSETAYVNAQKRIASSLKAAAKHETVARVRLDHFKGAEINTELQIVLAARQASTAANFSANTTLYKMLLEAANMSFVAEGRVKDAMKVLRGSRRLTSKADKEMVESMKEYDDLKNLLAQELEAEEGTYLLNLASKDPDAAFAIWNEMGTIKSYTDELGRKTGEMINYWEDLAARTRLDEEALLDARTIAQQSKDNVGAAHKLQLEQFKVDHKVKILHRDITTAEIEERHLERLLTREVKLRKKDTTNLERRLLRTELHSKEIQKRVDTADGLWGEISAEWSSAVRNSKKVPEDRAIVPLPGLGGYFWPDTLAQAARKYLQQDPTLAGAPGISSTVIQNFNSIYRATRGTLDNSAMWVHLLLRFYDNPASWQRVMRLSFQAWGVPLGNMGVAEGVGERAIDSFFRNFDDAATGAGRLGANGWAAKGLAITGADTEYSIGRGWGQNIAALPLLRNANRAFGAAGDAARLEWADDYLQGMLQKSSLAEITERGDLEKIAKAVNGATGWRAGRTGGVADLVLFAPRFFAARAETLLRAIGGAPSVLTQPYGAYAGRVPATLEQRLAARSMMKMIGIGTMLTYGANQIQGRETDFRPVIKREIEGREVWIKNTNFMRIRTPAGNDVSIFGHVDSLVGVVITSALIGQGGGPHEAIRPMLSGVMANAWDWISGSDAIGNPVGHKGTDGTNYGRITQNVLGNFVPFMAEDLIPKTRSIGEDFSSGDLVKAVSGMGELVAWEFQGGKTTLTTGAEERGELRQAHGLELLRQGYFDSPELSKDEVDKIEEVLEDSPWKFLGRWFEIPHDVRREIDKHQPIVDVTEKIAKNERDKGSKKQAFKDTAAELRQTMDDDIDEAWIEYGEVPNSQFRKRLKALTNNTRLKIEGLELSDEYKDFIQVWREHDPEARFDIIKDEYLNIMSVEDALGVVDYDKRNKALDDLRDGTLGKPGVGAAMMERIKRYLEKNYPEGRKQVKDLQDVIRPYWEVPDLVEEKFLASPLYSPEDRDVLRQYLEIKKTGEVGPITNKRQEARIRGITIISDYESYVRSVKDWMRNPNPIGVPPYENAANLDSALILGGYSGTPVSLLGLGSLEKVLEAARP